MTTDMGELGDLSSGAGLTIGRARLSAALSRLEAFVARGGRWLMLGFAAWVLGILAYLGLGFEPDWAWVFLGLSLAFSLALGLRSLTSSLWWLSLMALAAAAGFAVAKARTTWVEAPVLERQIAPVWLEGRISQLDARADGLRALIEVSVWEPPYETPAPRRVRLNLGEAEVALGQAVRIRAWLGEPPGPAFPGAFDFQFAAYFQGWGAVGRALDSPILLDEPPRSWRAGIQGLRQTVAARIDQQLSGDTAAVAKALLVGQRRLISEDTQSAIKDSGLAHLLAISGLHMTLVVGGTLFLVRILLSLVPAISLHTDTKRWAALAGLAMALFYLALSGASLPTQRAALMVGLVLLAMGLSRRPLTLRNLALVAWALTLWRPEVLLSASYQLSFAAVTLLILCFSALAQAREGRQRSLVARVSEPFSGSALSSALATLATGPFVLLHFHRLPILGLGANVIAVPLTGLWILPLGFLSLGLMPLGWEGPALAAMGWGIDALLALSHWTASLPGAVWTFPAVGKASLVLPFLALVWLAVAAGWWRLGALLPLTLFALWLSLTPKAVALITDSGWQVGAAEAGELRVRLTRRDRFTQSRWVEALGLDPEPAAATCDASGCVWQLSDGQVLALSLHPSAVARDCQRADLVLSPERVSYRLCQGGGWLYSGWDLVDQGSAWLRRSRDGRLRLETDAQRRGARPWTPYTLEN